MSKVDLTGAAENGHTEVVKYLVSRGADVNQLEKWNKRTLAAIFAEKGDVAMVAWLANEGADLSLVNLQPVAWKGHLEMIKYLVEKGADVNSGISVAAKIGNMKLVRELGLFKGADTSNIWK